ncbi:uncharacterized protein [Amphiura filiformis]|uniref:uncharacterized protein n=1 Tax=Amphiura filiformis TaxID=82378 RepID=UPI003B223D3D
MASIKDDLFREIRHTVLSLVFSVEGLQEIEPGALNFSLLDLEIVSGLSGKSGNNKITDFSPKVFDGIRMIKRLLVSGHNFTHLPPDLFSNTEFLDVQLDMNHLEELPDGFLRSSPNLTELSLYGNRLKYISNKTFEGLTSLSRLYLFRNQITEIPPLTFYETSLSELYIFGNNITSITKEALRTRNCTLQSIHLYYNCLSIIEEGAFDCTADGGCKVYYSKNCLSETPHFPAYVRM